MSKKAFTQISDGLNDALNAVRVEVGTGVEAARQPADVGSIPTAAPATDEDIHSALAFAILGLSIDPARALALIARIRAEQASQATAREQAIRECAEIAEGGLICLSCGHVGAVIECCDRMNFDGADYKQIATAILALLRKEEKQ